MNAGYIVAVATLNVSFPHDDIRRQNLLTTQKLSWSSKRLSRVRRRMVASCRCDRDGWGVTSLPGLISKRASLHREAGKTISAFRSHNVGILHCYFWVGSFMRQEVQRRLVLAMQWEPDRCTSLGWRFTDAFRKPRNTPKKQKNQNIGFRLVPSE